MASRWRMVVGVGLALACKATTGRPPFVPFPEAAHGEIGFGHYDPAGTVARVTRTVADALMADSIPVTVVREIDGYLETPWLDADSLTPTGRYPLGPDIVRVRAWVKPAKPGFSAVEIETVFRPFADPSLPARELEVHVPEGHAVARRVAQVMTSLVERYGEPSDSAGPARQLAPTVAPPPIDTAGSRPLPVRPDTTWR